MPQNDPTIVVEGLVRRFGSLVAVDDVTFSVERGSVFGLLGPNGAGKTTIVRILTTLLRADAGRALVAGIDVARQPAQARTQIGLAGQFAAVDENLTGFENLVMVGRLNHLQYDATRTRADELLERFDLSDARDRLVRHYSGGMRRRLDLAAALVNSPPVLFLDEPTTGLDPRSRRQLWEVIRELVADGATLLLTTQYLEEADQLADRIGVIDHGQLIVEGTSNELKAKVGGGTITVELRSKTAARKARAVLNSLGDVGESEEETKLSVSVPDPARSAAEVVRLLDDAGLPIVGLNLHEPTLDDVFLSLTGHKAEEVEEE